MAAMFKDEEGGLNLSDPDSWTSQEQESFTQRYMQFKGRTMPGHDLWIGLRPDVLKRYWHYVMAMNDETAPEYAHIAPLCYLHDYAVIGWEEGIRYQLANAQARGVSRGAAISTLAVAFIQSGPLGTSAVAAARDALEAIPETGSGAAWPDGWAPDPAYFLSGLEFSDADLSEHEFEALEDWYRHAAGEVPSYVRFMARHQPRLLKAYRHRFEYALKDGLPKQMMPIFMLQYEVVRSRAEGIREAALMARAMRIDKSYALAAIARGAMYGGSTSISVLADAAQDIFDAWS